MSALPQHQPQIATPMHALHDQLQATTMAVPPHLNNASVTASNVAAAPCGFTMPAMRPHHPMMMPPHMAQMMGSPTLNPAIASVPEALSPQVNALIANSELSQDMQRTAKMDAAIMESVRNALAHRFAGQAETYLPADVRQGIVHEVLQHAHHFRAAAMANLDMNITHLENMIGAHSAMGKKHEAHIKSHHPHLNKAHPDTPQNVQAANQPFFANNVQPLHPQGHIQGAGAEHHGTISHELQAAHATTH